jgi:RNA polymerase sigma-70 factor, ECF subfamily
MEDSWLTNVVGPKMVAPLDRNRTEMLAFLPRLRRFAFALTGRAADADDLVQDTIERALRNLDRFTPGTRMDSWMFRIAQNLWIDASRAKRTRGQTAPLEEAEQVSLDGRRAAEARLMLSETSRALAELPEEQRAVVALVLIDGLSYREAAAVLEVPIGTVTSRLARGREALAARVLGHATAQWEI